MTNQEAIASLRTLCNTCKLFPRCAYKKPECFQAIEMAISALQAQDLQQACNKLATDTIYRQAAIEAINHICPVDTEYDCTLLDRVDVRCVLSDLPSAQPEIIRCKDCKWKQGAECVRFAEVRPFPDDFCSRAERRTDERTD